MASVPCAICRIAVPEAEIVAHKGRMLCRTCFKFSAGPPGAPAPDLAPSGGRTAATARGSAAPIAPPRTADAHFGPTVDGPAARGEMYRPRESGAPQGRQLPERLLPMTFIGVMAVLGVTWLVTGMPRHPQPNPFVLLMSVPGNLIPALFLWAAARVAGVATATYGESFLATASANYTFYFAQYPVVWLAPADPLVRLGLAVVLQLGVSTLIALIAIRHFYVVSLGRATLVWLAYVGVCVVCALALVLVLGFSLRGLFLAGV